MSNNSYAKLHYFLPRVYPSMPISLPSCNRSAHCTPFLLRNEAQKQRNGGGAGAHVVLCLVRRVKGIVHNTHTINMTLICPCKIIGYPTFHFYFSAMICAF